MVVNGTNYSGIIPGSVNLVFEEEIKFLLDQVRLNAITPQELINFITNVEADVLNKQADLKDRIKNVTKNQLSDLAFIKEIMTEDGRILAHNAKNNLTPNLNTLNAVQNGVGTTIDGGSTGNDLSNCFQKVYTDPTKNTVTISKLISNCKLNHTNGFDDMVPLFWINTIPVKRKYGLQNNDIGKILLEVRISNPLMNFKGYITTGILDPDLNLGYGIGFLAEYCKSVDENDFIITAFKKDETIFFYMVKRAAKALVENVYDLVIPTKIDVTPIIGTDLVINQSIGSVVKYQDLIINGSIWVGTGNLNMNGHGPIDCIPEVSLSTNRFKFEYIKSKYYPANNLDSVKCKTNVPVKSKNQSKYFNLKVQPSSFGPTPSTVDGSQTLRPTFGSNHFDMLNLLKEIYDFGDNVTYKCFGNVVINGIFIPVIGFKISKSLGRVSFLISPYFVIPGSLWYPDMGRPDNGVQQLRSPMIIFTTNVARPHTFEPSGYIGDVDSDVFYTRHLPSKDTLFMMGYDSAGRVYYLKEADYKLHLVDIDIEISDSSGLVNKVQWDAPFRYSGDFNRYTYNFTKNDFDTYPYPGTNRDINGSTSSVSNIPSLTPENLIISGSDGSFEKLMFVDGSTDNPIPGVDPTLMDYVNDNLQQ